MVFKRLRTRMIANIVWIVAAVTAITFFFVYRMHVESLRKHLNYDAIVAAEMVENLLDKAMLDGKASILFDLLPELSQLDHIKKIRIVHPTGRIAFSSISTEKGTLLNNKGLTDFVAQPMDTLTYHVSDGQNTTFFKWKKLENEEACQKCHDISQGFNGVLWVETSEELSLSSLKSDYFVLGGIALGVIVFLSFATAVLFIRSVDRPVQELRTTIEALEQGDLSARTKRTGRDELGQLAAGLNSMAEKLQKAWSHLQEHHRQELNQAEALAKIGELAAGLAHEIKNPISGIVFAANSILRETDPSDSRKEIFAEMVKQANRVEQNLESLLTFARQSRLERFPTNLNAIIERILLFIRQQPDMKSIKTESALDDNLPEVLIDPKQIEQVFLNLIINAVQAMPNGGCLTVGTRYNKEGKKACVSIQDTGMGIPEERQEKVFLPFFSTKEKGGGLGLSLCKEIVARHSGRISFESVNGRGTIFNVELPVGSLETL